MIPWVDNTEIEYSYNLEKKTVDCFINVLTSQEYCYKITDIVPLLHVLERIHYKTVIENWIRITSKHGHDVLFNYISQIYNAAKWLHMLSTGNTTHLVFNTKWIFESIGELYSIISNDEASAADILCIMQTTNYVRINDVFRFFMNKVSTNQVLTPHMMDVGKYILIDGLWNNIVKGTLTYKGEPVETKVCISTDVREDDSHVFDYNNGQYDYRQKRRILNQTNIFEEDLEVIRHSHKKKLFQHEIQVYHDVRLKKHKETSSVLLFVFDYDIQEDINTATDVVVFAVMIIGSEDCIQWLQDNLFIKTK